MLFLELFPLVVCDLLFLLSSMLLPSTILVVSACLFPCCFVVVFSQRYFIFRGCLKLYFCCWFFLFFRLFTFLFLSNFLILIPNSDFILFFIVTLMPAILIVWWKKFRFNLLPLPYCKVIII